MIDRWNLTYTVTRADGAGTRLKGRYVEPTKTDFTIRATIQPLTDKEVLKLPEGERTGEMIKIYSATELNPAVVNGKVGDEISYDGNNYEIFGVKNWNKINNIKHFRMIARKIDPEIAGRTQE